MKRSYLILLIAILIMSYMVIPVSANSYEVEPRYTHINVVYGNIAINESYGIATCTGRIDAKQLVPVEVYANLQRKVDGQWVTVKTWTATGTRTAICTNNYAVYSNSEYRLSVWGYVLDSNGNILETGNVISYP